MAKETRGKVITKKHLARLERERIQRRNITIAATLIVILVIGLIGYGILDQRVLQPLQPVAVVDGDKITTKEFQGRVRYYRSGIVQQIVQTDQLIQAFGSDPNTAQYFQSSEQQLYSQLSDSTTLGQQVLDSMVEDRLIKHYAAQNGITVTPAEIDKALEQGFGYFPNGTPTPTAALPTVPASTLSPTQLVLITPTPTITPTIPPTATPTPQFTPTPTRALTPTQTLAPTLTPTPYTLSEYQQNLKNYVTNIASINLTEADLRAIVVSQLYRQKVMESIVGNLPHQQEQVWARQIVVTDEISATLVEDRLKKGEDFGKIASSVSIDTATKSKGGDMGWFPKSGVASEIANVVFGLKVTQISDPIKSSDGYHIVQVLGHENRQLTDSEYQTLQTQTFTSWLADLRLKAKVTINDFWKDRVPAVPNVPADVLQRMQQPISVPTSIAPQPTQPAVPTQAAPQPTQPAQPTQ